LWELPEGSERGDWEWSGIESKWWEFGGKQVIGYLVLVGRKLTGLDFGNS